ncbi:MAG: kinase/pyrophosphorylase [Arhodomonas sp.]|nr:kinase/pyrophosphorylase [Arhodomonas sp.]
MYAANYPLTEEDLLGGRLPFIIRPHRRKLYALTIRPERLSQIRGERRPDSRYAVAVSAKSEVARGRDVPARAYPGCRYHGDVHRGNRDHHHPRAATAPATVLKKRTVFH